MTKKIISTNKAPGAIGPYSQAIQLGDILFCSGQIPLNPENGEVIQGSISEQAHRVMKNIEAVLSAADFKFANICKTTIFLSDMRHFAEVNEVYASYFKEAPPARSCVAVAGLPKSVDVEIEVIAHR
ncbi:MAG: RidA family protein [Bdellovibrionales bacterium]|nr:RidA family protein [Bdellovibrionales bacterium]